MKLQVLVATMNQNDCSLIEKMNIRTDAVIANQCKRCLISEEDVHGRSITFVSTTTKGVGKNRNIALLASKADILLFSDDDVKYYDDCEKEVLGAFDNTPDADVIVFGMNFTKDGKIFATSKNENKKLSIFNALKYGTYAIAVRRSVVLKNRISFSELFGGGCLYSSGEDSLFLIDCIKRGLNIYSNEYILGCCAKDTSTWFHGYGEKFFYDKGAWIACAFPKARLIFELYYVLRFKREKDNHLSGSKMLQLMNAGYSGYQRLIGFNER